ncbi:MAG: hypothetical protein IPP88_24930 [Betaproteobacteria bacterium]|nr:hypothetical protein [Betaproteobacteria bacterium]
MGPWKTGVLKRLPNQNVFRADHSTGGPGPYAASDGAIGTEDPCRERRQICTTHFFGRSGSKKLQLPDIDQTTVQQFRSAFGITREHEPGLSIAVPFALDDITPEALVPEVIKNYFFPILTGKLIVEVGDTLIDADTFDDVAANCLAGSAMANRELMAFIRRVHKAPAPDAVLRDGWAEIGSMGLALDPGQLTALR